MNPNTNPLRKYRRLTSMNTRKIPMDTLAQFKAYCARRGYTMQAAIIALMRKAVEEDTMLPEARK